MKNIHIKIWFLLQFDIFRDSTLHWRHNDHDGVSPASRLFTQPFIQTQIKENTKASRHWPLCGEFTGAGEFPAQMASYAETVSTWWRHHDTNKPLRGIYHLPCIFISMETHLVKSAIKTCWWTFMPRFDLCFILFIAGYSISCYIVLGYTGVKCIPWTSSCCVTRWCHHMESLPHYWPLVVVVVVVVVVGGGGGGGGGGHLTPVGSHHKRPVMQTFDGQCELNFEQTVVFPVFFKDLYAHVYSLNFTMLRGPNWIYQYVASQLNLFSLREH